MHLVLIDGHPDANRLSAHLLDVYRNACKASIVDHIAIRDLSFDPVLHRGCLQPQRWEPDLLDAAQKIDLCDHLVIAFPMWWGAEPAVVKAFIDRLLLPHFAFRYHSDDPW